MKLNKRQLKQKYFCLFFNRISNQHNKIILKSVQPTGLRVLLSNRLPSYSRKQKFYDIILQNKKKKYFHRFFLYNLRIMNVYILHKVYQLQFDFQFYRLCKKKSFAFDDRMLLQCRYTAVISDKVQLQQLWVYCRKTNVLR